MKRMLAALVLLASTTAFAHSGHGHDHDGQVGGQEMIGEGRTGLTEPNDYYNPDYTCKIRDGFDMYLNMKPRLKLSASVFHQAPGQVGKVYTRYLHLDYSHQSNESEFYRIETYHECSNYMLEIGNYVRIWDGNGNIVSTCGPLQPRHVGEPPYYP